MLGAAAVPGVLLFAVALVSRKSPPLLMKTPCLAEAATELGEIRPAVDSALSFDVIGTVVNRHAGSASWARLALRFASSTDKLIFCLLAASAAWAEFGPRSAPDKGVRWSK